MNKIEISPKWQPLFKESNKDRYFVCTGGRGSSKSFSVTLYLLLLTFIKGHKILFTRYTMTSAKTSIIPQFIEVMDLLGYGDEAFEVNNDVITNKQTGSQILFKGIKTSSGVQTASLKSLTGITTFVVDEAEELVDEQVFNKINFSVRVKGIQNKVILIMNPTTVDNWIYNRWFLNGKTTENTTYIHTDYRDNIDNLNEDTIAEFDRLKETNPREYKHTVLGGWKLQADGVIYENWERGEFDTSLEYVFGSDFGYTTDPSTIMKIAVDEKRKLLYLEECYYGNCHTDTLVEIYKTIVQDDLVISDVDSTFINIARGNDINIYGTVKNKKGWNRAGAIKTIQSYKLVICGKSENTIKELNNYHWIKSIKHGYETSIPMDGSDHCLDPMRYGFQFLKTGS